MSYVELRQGCPVYAGIFFLHVWSLSGTIWSDMAESLAILSPLADKVVRQMRERIVQGTYPPRGRLESERELSRQFGVSRPTIRLALESLETHGLIKRFPRRGAVVTDRAGRAGSRVAVRHELLFVRWETQSGVLRTVGGMHEIAAHNPGQGFAVVDVSGSHERFLALIRRPPFGVKGMVLSVFEDDRYVEAIRQGVAKRIKFVLVDRRIDEFPDLSSVTADHFAAGHEATNHLIETHNRPVYFLGWTDKPDSRRRRYDGWAEAMLMHGFRAESQYILEITREEVDAPDPAGVARDAHELALSLFHSNGREKYSIFASNDFVAAGVYSACEAAGLAVGRDVFVVGFSDLPLCKRLNPPLSSVAQPYEQIGFESLALLYDEVNGRSHLPMHKVLPVELKVRASSTGKAARSGSA